MKELEEKILNLMNKGAVAPANLEKLSKIFSEKLKIKKEQAALALKNLEKSGGVFQVSKNKFASSEKHGLLNGRISFSSPNFGFVAQEGGDIYVAKRNAFGAFDGDTVLVKVLHQQVGGKRREGKILKILARDSEKIVGTFLSVKNSFFVRPERKNFDIFIPANKTLGAADKDKVVVDITHYQPLGAVGEVVEVIGALGKRGNDVKWILRQFKIKDEFPENVIRTARQVSQKVNVEKTKNRQDLREQLLFTIDGDDAKDFDDAVSVKKNSDGTFELGVHIADVGEYVRMASPIDEEAFRRGTSIYFLNQVIPMLPVELSNGICSLSEGADRLAISVQMKIDTTGEVTDSEIFESVIKSRRRLTYDEVLEVLNGNQKTSKRLGTDISQTLLTMQELSGILEGRRRRLGSLDFDLSEGKVIVDGDGKALDVVKRKATRATKLIESFMVAANETVAKIFFHAKLPFVFRVHEAPDPDKMATFYNFLLSLGISVPESKKEVEPRDLQKILNGQKGKDVESVVNMVMLRSLKKAKYLEKCLGHFGLSLRFYCHFTSPIRRYPDLIIHRIIKDYLHHNYSLIKSPKMTKFVAEASVQSSITEKTAEEVERAIEDYKKCEYMSQFVGESFVGIISGVNSRGFYVELENTCEGMVSISSLKDDFYNFDEATLALLSKHNSYRIGEKVQVQLVACNLNDRKCEFEVLKKIK